MNSEDIDKENIAAVQARSLDETPINRKERSSYVLEKKRKFPFRGYVDIEITGIPPFCMFTNNDDPVVQHYFWLGRDAWEPTSLKLWARMCKTAEKSSVALDIGAFSGLYSLAALKLGLAKCYAFEPSRIPFARLICNVNANRVGKRLAPSYKAVSAENGVTMFNHIRDIITMSTGASMSKDESAKFSELVQTATVDSIMFENKVEGLVSVIKVDVEGAEEYALTGMLRTIMSSRPEMIIETTAVKVVKLKDMLNNIGYEIFRVDEERGVLTRTDKINSGPTNYLFTLRAAEYKNEFDFES